MRKVLMRPERTMRTESMGSPSCTRMSPRAWLERTARATRSCLASSGRPLNRRILFTQMPFVAPKGHVSQRSGCDSRSVMRAPRLRTMQ
jgi:hypothetical protein